MVFLSGCHYELGIKKIKRKKNMIMIILIMKRNKCFPLVVLVTSGELTTFSSSFAPLSTFYDLFLLA